MKIQLIHKQKKSKSPFHEFDNMLTHVKIMGDNGKTIRFAKITPDLLSQISESIMQIGEREKVLCPNCKIEMLESTGSVFGKDYFYRQCPSCHKSDKSEIK